MIQFLHPDLFRFELIKPKNDNIKLTLLNVYTEPKNIELSKYSKTPFASIIIYREFDKLFEIPVVKFLEKCHTNSILSFKSETSDQYDEYKGYFDDDVKISDVIYASTQLNELSLTNNHSSEFIIIGGIPIKGMVSPILNSKNDSYSIYNGSLIVDNEFAYQGDIYKRLIYISASIDSYLVIDEYIKNLETINNFGTLITHEIYVDADILDKANISLRYSTKHRYISKVGRERLFAPSGKNIFPKSTLSQHIKKVSDSVASVDLLKAANDGKIKIPD